MSDMVIITITADGLAWLGVWASAGIVVKNIFGTDMRLDILRHPFWIYALHLASVK